MTEINHIAIRNCTKKRGMNETPASSYDGHYQEMRARCPTLRTLWEAWWETNAGSTSEQASMQAIYEHELTCVTCVPTAVAFRMSR